MLKFLASDKLQIFWLIFHAALGFVSVNYKWPLIAWVYLSFFSLIFSLLNPRTARFHVLLLIAYLLGFEVLARGIVAYPFLPFEMGKYASVALFGFALLLGGPIKRTNLYGIALLVLSLPALVAAEEFTRKSIVFNYFGPLAMFLGVIFCSKQILSFSQIKQLLRVMAYSIFALACFTIFRAAEFDKIVYGVSANYEAAGGTITNQVANLFGAGICIMSLMFLSNQTLFKYKALDLIILGFFIIRGLLTFSRGGMLSAAMAIALMVVWPKAQAAWQDNQIKMRSIPIGNLFIAGIVFLGMIVAVNTYTDNYLLYRYQGKTERSLQTGFTKDLDWDQWTTGRVTIAGSDMRMFLANPILGVGIGRSMDERPRYDGPPGQTSHIEFTRLFAEHGSLGMAMAIMIFVFPFFKLWKEPNNYVRSIRIVFLVMALSATFHNAMRTLITPVFFAFSFIKLVPDNYDWRKHLTNSKKQQSIRRRTAVIQELKAEQMPQ